jgi:hypothetical protein
VVKLRIETILLAAAFAIQTVFAFWGPIVQKVPVPPGDDPAFHMQYVQDLLAGQSISYPPLFHAVMAILHKISGLDLPRLFTWLTPLLLLAAPFAVWLAARKMLGFRAAAFATATLALVSPAMAKSFGDGNYPNMLSSLVLFPLAVLSILSLIEKVTLKRIVAAMILLVSLPLTHHLSLVWQIPALGLITFFALWQHPKNLSKLLPTLGWIALVSVPAIIFGGRWLLGNLGQGIAAGATVAPILSVRNLSDIIGIVPLLAGLFGLIILLRVKRSVGLTLLAWIVPASLLALSGWIGFTERFARELALPLSIAAGGFAEMVIFKSSPPLLARFLAMFIAGFLLLTAFQLPVGKRGIFALPEGFKALTRVDQAQLLEWREAESLLPETALVATNDPNPYLPFFLHRKIVADDKAATHIYLGIKPPNTPPAVYPYYGRYETATANLESLPNLTLIRKFPSGARLYSVTTNSQ